jgi:hypothetical protein
MTRILICAFLLCALCSICSGQTWSTLPVDMLINMNTSTPGTSLTSGIVSAGTLTNANMSFSSVTVQTGFTVGANQSLCSNRGPIQVNGTGGALLPAVSQNYNNIALADVYNNNNVILNVGGAASGQHVISAAGCIYIGPSSTETWGDDWDRYGLWAGGANGEYAMFQISQGSGCTPAAPTGYSCARMEGKPTHHSGYIFLQPQHAYWVSFWWNDSTSTVDGQAPGTMLLHIYTPEGTPIPCAVATTESGGTGTCTTLSASGNIAADTVTNQTATLTAGDFGGGLTHLTIGNNENGTDSTGTVTYFQNMMMNYTTAPFPLFWTSGSSGSVQPPTNLSATLQ